MGAERVGFVWPPSPLPEEGASPRTPDDVGRASDAGVVARRGPWRDALIAFERAWLDPVAEPFPRRAESIGWRPDGFEAYCDRCGHEVAAHEVSEFGCAACRGTRPAWDRFVRLGAYEPPLSLWIQETKFTRHHALALAMGRVLGRRVRAAGVVELGEVSVVPVPTTLRRRLVRGIDHAGMLAQGVASEIGAPVRRLLRRAHRPSQREVAPSERAANVRGAFRLARRARVEGRSVILVDDVSTSGATIRGCARVLRAGGATAVWVASVAVTREAGRRGGSVGDVENGAGDVEKEGGLECLGRGGRLIGAKSRFVGREWGEWPA